MALSRTSSKSAQTLYKISLKRDDLNPVFSEGMKNGKIKLLDSKESKIIHERFNEDIIIMMNEKDHFVSLKQRIDNECGYYSLISVFFSLIKKIYGKLDINFRNLLIEKATTQGITKDYKGISGVDLEVLVNNIFFDSKKVCSYQKGNPLDPRINGMIDKGHWVGQIPQKRGKSILLEPFSGKIFEADDNYLKKLEEDTLMHYRKMKGGFRNHDHKIFVNKELLFKFYKLFTKDFNLKSNKSSVVLSVIEEGENEGESSSSRSRSRRRSSRSRSRSRSSRSRSRSRSSRSRSRSRSSRSRSRSRSKNGGGIRKKNKSIRKRRR